LIGRSTVVELIFALPDLAGLDADALIVGTVSTPDGVRLAPGAEVADAALDGRLLDALTAVGASGNDDDLVKIPAAASSPVPLVVAVGLGPAPADGAAPAVQQVARAAGAATRALTGKAKVACTLGLSGGEGAVVELAAAAAEGALLGAYSFGAYRTGDRSRSAPPELVTVLVPDPKQDGLDAVGRRAGIVASAVAFARDLVNTPPNDLPPAELARRAEEAALAAGLEVEVLDEHALAAGGYGGVLGVGGGSQRPPRMVRIRHTGTGPKVALIGKGITFDSGGLSLKPPKSMETMKSDMGGAAAIIGAMQAIAALAPAVRVIGYLSIAENMPSGSAQRPSDVLTIYGGKTVEVLNTDAEGRLVLADALARSAEDSPDVVVDVATLTGAQVVALGTRISAVMANDDALRDAVVAAADRAGEAMWPMPLPAELRKGLDSTVADLVNVAPDRNGGMLVAGLFLREFVPEGVRWAHLDIAGPSFNDGPPHGYTPKGGTGAATRALVQIAVDAAEGRL
jgi:leucyl aminopeptidase